MVKRKNQPKKGQKAGYAAQTAQPVGDSTADDSSTSSSESPSSSSESDVETTVEKTTTPITRTPSKVAKKSTAPTVINPRGAAAAVPKPVASSTQLPATKRQSLLLTKKASQKSPAKNQSNRSLIKKRKSKPGVQAFKQIQRLQRTTNLLIPKAPFLRLVREIVANRSGNSGIRITTMALDAMREASESVLTGIFEDSYLIALHARRVTLMPRDMALLLNLRHDYMSGVVMSH